MSHIAIDVHRKTSTVAWLDPATGELGERKICTTRQELAELLETISRPWIVALEATRQSPAVCDWLRALDSEIHLVEPQKLHLLAQLANAKTDLKDARLMLHAMLHDYLPEAYLAPPAVAEKRDLYHSHNNLRQIATKLKNLLRSLLNKADLDLAVSDLLGAKSRPQVEAQLARLAPDRAVAARAYWDLLVTTEEQLAQVDKRIRSEVKADPLGRELVKLPGVGPIIAFGWVALLGSLDRFASWKQLCSYAGLAPRSARSDEFHADGHLPQRCNKALRHVTMLAVQSALNAATPSRAQRTYERLAKRKPKATAKVAAGRELLRDVYFLGQRLAAD